VPEKTGPAAVGRPSKFKPEHVEQARKLTQLGAELVLAVRVRNAVGVLSHRAMVFLGLRRRLSSRHSYQHFVAAFQAFRVDSPVYGIPAERGPAFWANGLMRFLVSHNATNPTPTKGSPPGAGIGATRRLNWPTPVVAFTQSQ
jgi:hypothetical protein